jgi:SPP1 gp7 family putative phage head morphogenesis protein
MPNPSPISVKPLDAIEFIRSKLALPTETFTDIWREQHAKAFVVAGANTEAIIADLHNAVLKEREAGGNLKSFQKSWDEIVAKHGWSYKGSRGWRSRLVYETNMRQAALAAKWKSFWLNRKSKPYLRYVGILDDRIRPLHRAWHNTVLPIEDPWWDTHYPMNGYGCRCDVQALDDYWVKKYGLRVQPEAPYNPEVTRPVRSAAGTYYVTTPKGIDPGFDYNVGRAALGGPQRPIEPGQLNFQPLTGLSGGKPVLLNPLPLDQPLAQPLTKVPQTEDGLRQALRDAIGGDDMVIKDAAGAYVRVNQSIVDHMLAKDIPDPGRSLYFPLIRELIESPAEIWIGFDQNKITGKVRLRRRYVKLVTLKNNKVLGLVSDVEGRNFIGLTFFVGRETFAERLRSGYLIYEALVKSNGSP